MRAVRRAARPTTISMTWRGRGRPRRRPGLTGPSPPCAASTRSWGSDGGTARHVRLLRVPPRPRRAPVPATAAGPHRRDADRPRRAERRLSGGIQAQKERGGVAAIPGIAPRGGGSGGRGDRRALRRDRARLADRRHAHFPPTTSGSPPRPCSMGSASSRPTPTTTASRRSSWSSLGTGNGTSRISTENQPLCGRLSTNSQAHFQ